MNEARANTSGKSRKVHVAGATADHISDTTAGDGGGNAGGSGAAVPPPPASLPVLHEAAEHNDPAGSDGGGGGGGGGGDEEESIGKATGVAAESGYTQRRSAAKGHKEDISLPLEDPPMFDIVTTAGERGNCLSKMCMGAPPSPQESLFWLDRHGPHMALYMIRLLLVLNAFYVTFFVAFAASHPKKVQWDCYNIKQEFVPYEDPTTHANYTESESIKPGCAVLIAAGVFPPIIMVLMLGATIQKLVVVTHVEEMRSSEKIAKTVRTMKARKALVALKLLTKLKKTTTKKLKKSKKHGGPFGGGFPFSFISSPGGSLF